MFLNTQPPVASALRLLAVASVFIAACAAPSLAQLVPIGGKVTMRRADGTAVPVAGAQIDIYRTDIKWEDHIKTDRNGEYAHAGVPFVGTFTVAVSAPGAKPTYRAGLRLSRQPQQDFQLEPGDGSRLSLDQIRAAGNATANPGGPAPSESGEARAAREESERKNAEIEKKNAEIVRANEIVARTFKAGNDALSANPPRYDEAVAAYAEGLAAQPDEPALLTNLSEALRRRGVERFNTAARSTGGDDAKSRAMDAAKKDWADAADDASKALAILKALPQPDAASRTAYEQNRLAAISTRALALRLVATKVDQSKAAETLAAYQEYVSVESDPARKARIRAEALQTLFDAGANDLAIAEARKALAADADDMDADRVLGMALFASGDKAKYQEAANHLQRYVDEAPDSDPLKASTKEALNFLLTSENIKPQPTARPAGGRRRP